MHTLRNLMLIALGLCFALELSAQQAGTSPALSQLPWWDYRPSRISNEFQTIIGQSGTTMVSGSSGRYYYTADNMYINMPFA